MSKLSKLYSGAPIRTTKKPADQELIDYYTKDAQINTFFNDANESFNAYKSCALELYHDEASRKLLTRNLPAHQFVAYSSSEINPMKMTEFVKIMPHGDSFKLWVFSNNEFFSMDMEGVIQRHDMLDGADVNEYGVIPFSYMTRSRYLITPLADTDTVRMSTLIPVLLTDLNFASMMLSNPIIYTIDADGSNMSINPNMYLDLKSDTDGVTPQVGVIKPEPNIDAQINLVKNQLSMWLQSINIKPGSVGSLTAENAVSGISLMIQEMETTEDRITQQHYFKRMEQDFWRRLAIMHNELASRGQIENRSMFSDPATLQVDIDYQDDIIVESVKDKVARIKDQLDAGLISKQSAMKVIDPGMDDEQIMAELELIKKEGEFTFGTAESND